MAKLTRQRDVVSSLLLSCLEIEYDHLMIYHLWPRHLPIQDPDILHLKYNNRCSGNNLIVLIVSLGNKKLNEINVYSPTQIICLKDSRILSMDLKSLTWKTCLESGSEAISLSSSTTAKDTWKNLQRQLDISNEKIDAKEDNMIVRAETHSDGI